uniref:Uncharacterized protein n=1 Tax=Arion vulgaris TaxID=1028688 RepID=A0A0B7BKN9_9EUPU
MGYLKKKLESSPVATNKLFCEQLLSFRILLPPSFSIPLVDDPSVYKSPDDDRMRRYGYFLCGSSDCSFNTRNVHHVREVGFFFQIGSLYALWMSFVVDVVLLVRILALSAFIVNLVHIEMWFSPG